VADLFETSLARHRAGDAAGAISGYQAYLADHPDHADATHFLAMAYFQSGQHDRIEPHLARSLSLAPQRALFRYNAGLIRQKLGQPDLAADFLRQAIALQPGYARALVALGAVELQRGGMAAAHDALAHAVRLGEDGLDTLSNLSYALLMLGRLPEAEEVLRRIQARDAAMPEMRNNLALLYRETGRMMAAIGILRKLCAEQPEFQSAFVNLAVTLCEAGHLLEAERLYQEMARRWPDFAAAVNNHGILLADLGRVPEAVARYRPLLERHPDLASGWHCMLYCLNYDPDLTAAGIFAEYRRWDAARAPVPEYHPRGAPRTDHSRDGRLRLGFVSPDFRNHSCSYFTLPVLQGLDRRRFEVVCYSELPSEDDATRRLKAVADGWCTTMGMSHAAMAQRIHDDKIDILIDLAGHTARNRLHVFAYRPAPMQATWLGFGSTTGMQAIDWFIGDPHFTPPGCEEYFAEKIWRLPGVFAVYRPPEGCGDVGPLPAETTGEITFSCLSRSVRVNHRVIRVWAEILRRLPGARLQLNSRNYRDQEFAAELRARFVARGARPEQLEIGFTSPPWDVYRATDIVLDCFPHNSGTTSYEALWMGVPVLTLADRPSVGRLGASVLQAMGMPGWIARDEADYVERAVAFAQDIPGLAVLRRDLRPRMAASPLVDQAAFLTNFSAALEGMWAQH